MEVIKDTEGCGIYRNSIKIEATKLHKLKNVYVSKRFSVKHASNRHLSTFLENLDSFTAEEISIAIGSISWKQIHSFLKHNLVSYLHLQIGKKKHFDWPLVIDLTEPPFKSPDFVVDDLIPYLTNANFIRLVGIQCTEDTSKMFLDTDFKKKIEVFELYGLNSVGLEPEDFAKFVNKRCAIGARVSWTFLPNVNEAYKTSFYNFFREHLKKDFSGNAVTRKNYGCEDDTGEGSIFIV